MLYVIKKENLIEKNDYKNWVSETVLQWKRKRKWKWKKSIGGQSAESSQSECLFKKLTKMSPLLQYMIWRLNRFVFWMQIWKCKHIEVFASLDKRSFPYSSVGSLLRER